MQSDLLIIGAGPAGYDAALQAARRGIGTVLVEKEHLGGSCLNFGCIPTKFLLAAVAPKAELEGLEKMKTGSGQVLLDLAALVARKERYLEATRKAQAAELQKLGVALMRGRLKAVGTGEAVVDVAGEVTAIAYRRCILATGSLPANRPGLTADHETILNSGDILGLKEIPARLLVIGAGFIGMELAQFFSRAGSHITLFEVADRIAPTEDEEISKALGMSFKRMGWDIHTGVKIAELKAEDGQARLTLEDGREFAGDKCLLAAGRVPCSTGIGLHEAGAAVKSAGWVATDEHLMAAPTLYAVGDVNGRAMLAHAASHQGEWAVRHLVGEEKGPYAPGPVPGCMYGAPETMRVGVMEAEARAKGMDVHVSRAQLVANPIAQAHGATGGLVKCVWSDAKLIGVTAAGHGVASLAALSSVLVGQGWTKKQCEGIIFPHPTLDEALKAALLAGPQS